MAAIIDSAPPAAVQQAANRAVEALWDHELQAEVRAELTAFRNEFTEPTSELVAALDAALAALGRPPSDNLVAHALIWRATAELMRRVNRNYDRVAHLEKALVHARPNQHRALTLSVAAAASLAVDVGDEEDEKAIAQYLVEIASHPPASRKRSQRAAAGLARTLATDERRQSMRTALAELASVSADEFPLAAAALNKLLAEPVPRRSREGRTLDEPRCRARRRTARRRHIHRPSRLSSARAHHRSFEERPLGQGWCSVPGTRWRSARRPRSARRARRAGAPATPRAPRAPFSASTVSIDSLSGIAPEHFEGASGICGWSSCSRRSLAAGAPVRAQSGSSRSAPTSPAPANRASRRWTCCSH